MEIEAEEAEFPHLVGDVLADVGDDAVGAHNHFRFGFLAFLGGRLAQRHDPAAGVLAGFRAGDDAAVDHLSESRLPEIQFQDVTFAGEQVVANAEPLHGFQVAAENGGGNDFADFGFGAVVLFDGLEGLGAEFEA